MTLELEWQKAEQERQEDTHQHEPPEVEQRPGAAQRDPRHGGRTPRLQVDQPVGGQPA